MGAQGWSSNALGVKNSVLAPPDMFILRRSTAGDLEVPFSILSRKKSVTGEMCRERIGTFL